MGAIKDVIDNAFRDFVTDGVEASGRHEVQKPDCRAIGPTIEAAIAAVNAAGLAEVKFDTKANLDADLAHDDGTTALVYADADEANNDLWIKNGASGAGAWVLSGTAGIIHDTVAVIAQPHVDDAEAAQAAAEAAAASVAADRFRMDDIDGLAQRETDRLLLPSNRPSRPVIALRFGPGQRTIPSGWTWNGGTGDRYTWDEAGALVDVPDGQPRHRYAATRLGGDGRWLGVLLEPYGTNACGNPTMAGGVAGAPGVLPTNWSETAGHGLARTIVAVGTEDGVPYIDVNYAGVSTATSLTLWTGSAASYVNEAGATIAVAAGQLWCASGFARQKKNTGNAVTGGFAVAGQLGTVADSNGAKPIPLSKRLRRGHSIRNLTGAPTGVQMGYRFFFANGAAIDFTVRLALPQLEPQGFASSPIPVAGGRRMADYLTMTGTALTDRWAAGKLGTMYAEFVEPYWITDGTQRRSVQLSDTSGGGRFAIEGYNNAASAVGQNWDGAASTTVAIPGFFAVDAHINNYGPVPETVCKWAGRFGTDDTAICRDNHQLAKDAAGTVFTATAIGSIRIGFTRPIVFREFALWDRVMNDAEMRALTRNYENHRVVDEFRRPDSIADTTNAPYHRYGRPSLNGPSWAHWGATGGDPGQAGFIEEQEIRANWVYTAGNVATYDVLPLEFTAQKMGVLARWRDVPNRVDETASVALPCTANEGPMIAAITTGSLHPTFLINSLDTGYYAAGVLTKETIAFTKVAYDTDVFFGFHLVDGRVIYELPDGRIWEPTASTTQASKAGRNAVFELFGSVSGDVRNEVSIRTAFAD